MSKTTGSRAGPSSNRGTRGTHDGSESSYEYEDVGRGGGGRGRSGFSTGLCDCSLDTSGCCYGCWCGPCLAMEMRALRGTTDPSPTDTKWGVALSFVGGTAPWVLACLDRMESRMVYDVGAWSTLNDGCAVLCCTPCSICQTTREHYTRFPNDPRPECSVCGLCSCSPSYAAAAAELGPRGWKARHPKSSRARRDPERGDYPYPIPADLGSSEKSFARVLALVLAVLYVVFAAITVIHIASGAVSPNDAGDVVSLLATVYLQFLMTRALKDDVNDTRRLDVFIPVQFLLTIGFVLRFFIAGYSLARDDQKGSEYVRTGGFAVLALLSLLQTVALNKYRNTVLRAGYWFIPPVQTGEITRSSTDASSNDDDLYSDS